jgi:SAM-dependent methyltransferase
MTIDLVFITYNRLHYTKLALASVLADPTEQFGLTIWDNASRDRKGINMEPRSSSERHLTSRVKLSLKRLFIDDVGMWSELYYLFLASIQAVVTRQIVERHAKEANQIIDIGSRRSPYTKRLRSKVTYLDLPSETDGYLGFTSELSEAMKRLPNREVVYGSALDLPFDKELFDMALCIEVIEHIDEDEKALSEIYRVLKDGGVALFTTPNGEVVPNENPYHCRHYTPAMFERLLRSHFSQVQVWTECPWPTWVKSLDRLKRGAEERKGLLDIINYSVQRALYLMSVFMIGRSLPGCMLVAKAIK